MNVTELFKRAERLTVDNSPAILTAIGVAGTITTAYLAGKATYRAAELLDDAKRDLETDGPPLSNREKFELVWKLYLPPALAGTLTVGAIISANRIGSKRAAAMAAAYTLSEKAYSEYKEKVVEKLGEKKEKAYRDEVAQRRVDQDPVGKNKVHITGGGDVLCYDLYTGRYFQSSMETIKKAVNDVNFQVINNWGATLNDLYAGLGLSRTKIGEEVGWRDSLLEMDYSTTMSDDDRPCICLDYKVEVVRGDCKAD